MIERISIEVPGDGQVSAVVARVPSPAAAIVLAHGAGNDMDSPFMRTFHEGLAERGFSTLRFNFVYKQAGRKLPDARPLLEACFRAAADSARSLAPRLVLGGKSMGGRIASHLVASGYSADALVFLGYPLHPPGKPEQLRDQHLYSIGCPMLFLSGTRDAFATPHLLEQVVDRIGSHATLTWIDGADHSYRVRGRPQQQVYAEALDMIAAWLKKVMSH